MPSSPSTPSSTDPEHVVREFLRLLALPDTAAAVALLDPDVQWRNTGAPTVRGARVHRMLRDMEGRGVGFGVELHHVAVGSTAVLTDRTDIISVGRWRTSFPVRGTFVVTDGLIVLWDDQFNYGQLVASSLLGLGRALLRR